MFVLVFFFWIFGLLELFVFLDLFLDFWILILIFRFFNFKIFYVIQQGLENWWSELKPNGVLCGNAYQDDDAQIRLLDFGVIPAVDSFLEDFFDEIENLVKKFVIGKEYEGVFLKPKYGDASGVRGAARLGRKSNY